MYICISKLTIISSDNGLLPHKCQTIIWTNDEILLVGPLGTNLSEILIEIQTFPFKKMHLKMSSENWQPNCLDLNVLIEHCFVVETFYVSDEILCKWWNNPYPTWLPHLHHCNSMIALMLSKWPWRMWRISTCGQKLPQATTHCIIHVF